MVITGHVALGFTLKSIFFIIYEYGEIWMNYILGDS